MASYAPSLIRTFVPVAVGAVVAWLGVRGLHLDPAQQATATAIATTLVTSVYYALVRALETKFPAFGLMLGYKAKPVYKAGVVPVNGGDLSDAEVENLKLAFRQAILTEHPKILAEVLAAQAAVPPGPGLPGYGGNVTPVPPGPVTPA